MSANTEQRRRMIQAEVYEKGRVLIKDLAAEYGVSEATIRRDLKALDDEGGVELITGGATLPRISDFSFHSKGTRNVEAKRKIGRLAATLVGDNDQVFLDSGTTCFQMVPYLKQRHNLSIIANSTRLALELDAPGVQGIIIGGQYRPERMDSVGPLATRMLENLRGYLAIIGADGLSMDFGLTASDIESAHLNGLAVANARETVLVADHSKFLSPSLYKIVDFDAISRIVTDRWPNGEWMRFLDRRGIEVLVAEEADRQAKAGR
ncbi:MAG: DeoR/GlpR family DNA-binding transcription regulator [Candidatus Sumerlaeota bacterium]